MFLVDKGESMTANEAKQKRILIIDDDEVITGLIQTLLSKEGYTVYTANNGLDGEKMA